MSEKNKIDILKFVEGYKKVKSETAKKAYVAEKCKLINTYIPTATKLLIADMIANASTHKQKTVDGNVINGDFHINSTASFYLYTMNLIDRYTNLHVDFKEMLLEYDRLNEVGLIKTITDMIPESERVEIKMLLDLCIQDIITNEYEGHAFIKSQVDRFSMLFGTLLSPAIEKLSEVVEKLDDKKLQEIGKTFGELINRGKDAINK